MTTELNDSNNNLKKRTNKSIIKESNVNHHQHNHQHNHSHNSSEEVSHLLNSFMNLNDKGSIVTLIGLSSNIGLTLIKAIAGIWLNSAALLADAVHSGSDLLADIVTLSSYTISRKPANSRYPHGYGSKSNCFQIFVNNRHTSKFTFLLHSRIRKFRIFNCGIPFGRNSIWTWITFISSSTTYS